MMHSIWLVLVLGLQIGGCSSVYYSATGKVGIHKPLASLGKWTDPVKAIAMIVNYDRGHHDFAPT